MNRKCRRIAAILALASVVVAAPARAGELVIAADTWCPYNCTPTSDQPGYVVELAKQIFARHGHSIQYRRMPWKRARTQTARGEIDAAIAVSTEPEVEDMILPKEPIGYLNISLVTRADSDWTYTGRQSLSGKFMGIHKEYPYPKPIETYAKRHPDNVYKADGSDALETILDLIVRERIDVFPLDTSVANYLIQKFGYQDELRLAGTVGEGFPLYLGFSKNIENAEQYAAIWTTGVRRLRQRGELQPILDRYNLADWKQP